jgi:hypothetical protein
MDVKNSFPIIISGAFPAGAKMEHRAHLEFLGYIIRIVMKNVP